MLLKEDSFFRTIRFHFVFRYFGFFITLLTILLIVINHFASVHVSKKSDEKIIETLNDLDWVYSQKDYDYILDKIKMVVDYKAIPQGIENVFYIYLANDTIISASDLKYWHGIDSLLHKQFKLNTFPKYDNDYWLSRIKKFAYIKRFKYKSSRCNLKIGYFELGKNEFIIMGLSLKEDILFKKQLTLILILSFSIILLFGFVLVYFLINNVMFNIESITDTAIKIEKGDLNKRVELISNKREINNLIVSFNKMLERINSLLREIKEVSDNIAHDLRSPVTSIRIVSETALSVNISAEEEKLAFQKIIIKCDYLVSMINTLLEISEIEINSKGVNYEQIDIKEIVTSAYDLYVTLAEEKNIAFELNFDENNLFILGNRTLIQRAISNIVDNAIKFNQINGLVSISVYKNDNAIELEVSDTGIGIDENDQPKIFNKFYRSDKSRTQEGNGLGLSFAQAVIKRHNGFITVFSHVNEGTSIKVMLPEFK